MTQLWEISEPNMLILILFDVLISLMKRIISLIDDANLTECV